jgi:hypothetical protein
VRRQHGQRLSQADKQILENHMAPVWQGMGELERQVAIKKASG